MNISAQAQTASEQLLKLPKLTELAAQQIVQEAIDSASSNHTAEMQAQIASINVLLAEKSQAEQDYADSLKEMQAQIAVLKIQKPA